MPDNVPRPSVLYRHPDWILVDKPSGFSVQDLCTAWQHECDHPLHPVHRLDKDTSGLWLLATKPESNELLSQAFAKRQIDKSYICLTVGKPVKKQGAIKGDMEKSRRSQWKLLRSSNNPAITHFKSVGYAAGSTLKAPSGLRLVVCKPETGKTHQLRVAMNANGTPIAGDVIYNKEHAGAADRLYLHALGLRFSYKGQLFEFVHLPEDGAFFDQKKIQTVLDQVGDVFLNKRLVL